MRCVGSEVWGVAQTRAWSEKTLNMSSSASSKVPAWVFLLIAWIAPITSPVGAVSGMHRIDCVR